MNAVEALVPQANRLPPGDTMLGRVVSDRYRVDEPLGSGGMGTVYRAYHLALQKPVALKLLHGEMALRTEAVARFEREAVVGARLEHPHVVSAVDFGQLGDGSYFLVLELVTGRPLTSLIEQGPVPPLRAVRIAKQIAQALDAAHRSGVVHRDLKPDNVMLVERGDNPDFVKLLDFGIAKLEEDENQPLGSEPITRMGAIFGTTGYMAPEQAVGQPVDAGADLYSLGVVLFEMLTGSLPFGSGELSQILARQLTEPPPHLPAECPAALCLLVDSLLDKERVLRPPDAASVAEKLEHIEAVLDAPPSFRRASLRVARAFAVEPGQKRASLKTLGLAAFSFAAFVGLLLVFVVGSRPTLDPMSAELAPRAKQEAQLLVDAGRRRQEKEAREAQARAAAESARAKAEDPGKARAAPAKTNPKQQSGRGTQSSKRKTGPMGIYIPPPSQWFK